jgi:hypothetical protein
MFGGSLGVRTKQQFCAAWSARLRARMAPHPYSYGWKNNVALARPAVLAGMLALSSAACSLIYRADIERTQCVEQADCVQASQNLGLPLVCRASACQLAPCASNEECPANSTCVSNMCVGTLGGAETAVPCALDSDCGGGNRCGFDGFCYAMWGCLDVDRERPVAPTSLRYTTLVRSIETDDPASIGDLAVTACSVIDPTCAVPNVGPLDFTVTPDKQLTATFHSVPMSGFIGALQVDALPATAGILPSYVHFTGDSPLFGDFYAQTPLLLIRAELFNLLAVSAAVTLDPAATTIAVRVHDCGGRTAPGVFMAAPGSPAALFVPLQADRVPVVGGTETTEDGGALLVNVPASRPVPLAFTDLSTGRVLSDDALLTPRASAINYLFWYPRQSAAQKWLAEARKRGLTP